MTWFIALSVCLVSVASIQAQQSVTGLVPGSLPTLAEGRFRKALDATATPVMMDGETAYRQPPLTLECWVKLSSARQINVIVSCDPRQSSQHWCLQSQSGTGKIELYLPGYSPQYISGDAVLADGKWHAAAFTFDGTRVKLFVDGALTAEREVVRQGKLSPKPGYLCIGMAIDGNARIGCHGLIDDVRLSRTVREIRQKPEAPALLDPLTLGLWTFDQVDQLAGDPAWTPRPANGTFPDWEKAQERSWVDGRLREMDTGPSFNGTFQYPGWSGQDFVYKGTALRLGDHGQAAVLFDRCQFRYACGWTGGFLHHKDTRFGLMNTPKPAGTIAFSTTARPGWAHTDGQFEPVPARTLPLPEQWGKFRGLHLHGNRPVFEYQIGTTRVWDAPWFKKYGNAGVFSRTIECQGKSSGMTVFLAEVAGTNFQIINRPTVPQQSTTTTISTILTAEREGQVTALAVKHPVDCKFQIQQGRVDLVLPAFEKNLELEVLVWNGLRVHLSGFLEVANRHSSCSIQEILQAPLIKRWGEPLITQGELARDDKHLVVDTLTIPYENRFKALFFCSGLDVIPDGDIAICTAHGDVWIIKGIDAGLKELRWHRFATGLYHPLGLKVVDGHIYVLERGQITRLIDKNNDGEADYYECITNNWHTGPGEHSYDSNLEVDAEGNFYFFKTGDDNLPHGGTLLRCHKDGSNLEVFCTGFRHPMALSVSPRGQVTGSDQEGNWIPSTRVDFFQRGGFYGFMPGHHRPVKPTTYDDPVCWLPRSLCNSAGGHSWVPEGGWGPLSGQLLHLSYGRCRMAYVFPPQEVGGKLQSGAVDLGVKFLSGIFRGRFHPGDGHFYACGLNGWQTAAARDGCLQRVRRTEQPLNLPLELHAVQNGILVRFSQPLDQKSAGDVSRYGFSQWNYRYSGEYGSKNWSVAQPNREGVDVLSIRKAVLQPDDCSVFLDIPGLRPAMQCHLTFDLQTKEGTPCTGDIYHTIYRLVETPTTKPKP